MRGEELPNLAAGGASALWRLSDGLRAAGTRPIAPNLPQCPDCQTPLSHVAHPSLGGLRLHTCAFCRGYWLTADDLRAIAARLTAQTNAAEAEAEASAKAAKQAERAVPPDTRRVRADPEGAHLLAAKEPEPCPKCSAENPACAPVCWACGFLLHGPAVGECPRCHGTLHELVSNQVTVAGCDGCGGVLVEDGRLGALMLQSWEELQPLLRQLERVRSGRIPKHEPQLLCPRCALVMYISPLGTLTREPIGNCPICSALFFDYGTLQTLLRDVAR